MSVLVWSHLRVSLSLSHTHIGLPPYRKIPKINPSKLEPPKLVTQKTLRWITPPNIYPPGACTWKISLKYKLKVKQSKHGKFASNCKASPIDFETQISLRS